MTDEEVNKDLQEKVMKKCWHKADPKNVDECLKCQHCFEREDYEPYNCEEDNLDYINDWNAYGKLLTEAKKNKDFVNHLKVQYDWRFSPVFRDDILDIIAEPFTGSMVIWNFFCRKDT